MINDFLERTSGLLTSTGAASKRTVGPSRSLIVQNWRKIALPTRDTKAKKKPPGATAAMTVRMVILTAMACPHFQPNLPTLASRTSMTWRTPQQRKQTTLTWWSLTHHLTLTRVRSGMGCGKLNGHLFIAPCLNLCRRVRAWHTPNLGEEMQMHGLQRFAACLRNNLRSWIPGIAFSTTLAGILAVAVLAIVLGVFN